MSINAQSIWSDVVKIREKSPLVHNITNYVVMNSTARRLPRMSPKGTREQSPRGGLESKRIHYTSP